MKLTIEQIKTIIKAAEKAEQKKDKEISELVKLFLDKVFEQTNIRNLKDLKKIIVLYDSYKENDWFKQGLEKVLLEGQFPYFVSERTIIKENPTTVYPPIIWNKATCDMHHILPKKYGGTDDNSNLVILCPNCHRMVHNHSNEITKEMLLGNSLDKVFKQIKEVYHSSN